INRAVFGQSMGDMDLLRAQLRHNGRRYLIDVVMQTPRRFSDAFRDAVEAELPVFAPAMLRARFHLWESGSPAQMVDALSRIRGSHGVVLKAQDAPEVAEAVDRLVGAGVPVVTYATDVPTSARQAYVGIDNHGAGVTAAYLMDQWLGSAPSGVLITLSRSVFRGEGEREVGFRSALRASGREVVEVSGSDGIDETNEQLVLDALERHPGVEAVYSPGGGNTATVAAFERIGRVCRVFIAHDLDADNRRLLRDGRISVVLHNDLRADARRSMRLILQHHGALPAEAARLAPIQVITPYNLPS
ncbi:MAG: substrate-binding domain-containing protein, partial [Mycobacterium sp.]